MNVWSITKFNDENRKKDLQKKTKANCYSLQHQGNMFFMFSAFGLQITIDDNNKIIMGTQAVFFQILLISKFC